MFSILKYRCQAANNSLFETSVYNQNPRQSKEILSFDGPVKSRLIKWALRGLVWLEYDCRVQSSVFMHLWIWVFTL